MTIITLTSRQPSSRKLSKDFLAQHGSISRERFQQRRPKDAIHEAKERTTRSFAKIDCSWVEMWTMVSYTRHGFK